VHDELVNRCAEAVERFYGPTAALRRGSADYARLIDDAHWERVVSLLEEAVSDGATVALGGAALLLALPAVAAVAWAYLRTTNVEYVLTERNLYRKAGVLSTHVSRIDLSTVQRTSLTKTVWGTLFHYGTIEISTAGSEGADLRLTDLDDPGPVRGEIRRLTGRRQSERGVGARTATATAAATPIDAATADALLDDVRALREAATRVERGVGE